MPLTVVGFASGSPLSQQVMARVAREHRLAAIVSPRPRMPLLRRLKRIVAGPRDPLSAFRVPLIGIDDVARFAPDAIVVASFPQVIPAGVLEAAKLGAFNVHMSLLPRHRGSDPVFWTYWNDDAEAGVTVHWVDARLDTGPIAAQTALPLPRGLPSRELYLHLAARGVDLLGDVLAGLSAGRVDRRPQARGHATYRSSAHVQSARIPHAQWPSERVWHVVAGLGDQRSGLLAGADGAPLPHGRARSFEITAAATPGRIDVRADGYAVHCLDGIVMVDRRTA